MIGITERGDAGLSDIWVPWVKEGRPAILITKSPQLLKIKLDKIENLNVIIHCTITGWGGTILEPGVKSWEETILSYKILVDKYGPDRVVLRIDPIIPTEKGVARALLVYKHACSRVRISFMDAYPHVRERLIAIGQTPLWAGIHARIETRMEMLHSFPNFQKIEVCGEPDMICTGCVSLLDCQVLGVDPVASSKGQRAACACMSLKQELLNTRGQCEHKCIYCYWR